MSEKQSDIPDTPDSEIDEPTLETVDPYANLEVRDGIGVHDQGAKIMDTDAPDLNDDDEPSVDEPEEVS